ncbi:hypothetical protein HanPI659440_Chr03g0124151 [Helianthus annuus]|nr:hypothetical protein HanPI659440_Chr03g0124151 [Helianthus annuus]
MAAGDTNSPVAVSNYVAPGGAAVTSATASLVSPPRVQKKRRILPPLTSFQAIQAAHVLPTGFFAEAQVKRVSSMPLTSGDVVSFAAGGPSLSDLISQASAAAVSSSMLPPVFTTAVAVITALFLRHFFPALPPYPCLTHLLVFSLLLRKRYLQLLLLVQERYQGLTVELEASNAKAQAKLVELEEREEQLRKLQQLCDSLVSEKNQLVQSSTTHQARHKEAESALEQSNAEVDSLTSRLAGLQGDKNWLITNGLVGAFEYQRQSESFVALL